MSSQYYIRCWLLLLLLNSTLTAHAQNYLNDGGFQIPNSDYTPSLSCGRVSTSCTSGIGIDGDYYIYCPGGIASVKTKMLYWTNAGSVTCSGDLFCAPHAPDWIYSSPLSSNVYTGSLASWNPIYSYGAIGAKVDEMFQQQMATSISAPGSYLLSVWIRTNTNPPSAWPTDVIASGGYNIRFILSANQASYQDNSCQSDPSSPSSDYFLLANVNPSTDLITEYLMPTYISDWKLIEVPITVTNPTYNWLSVDVDGQGEIAQAYFGFDQIYISDTACFCPIVRNVVNQTFSDIRTGAEAQEYLNLVSGNSVVLDGSNPVNVLFTAGNAITVTPGFNTVPGVTSELKIADCFSNTPAADFLLPNPYTLCSSDNEICIQTKNITEYQFTVTDELGQTTFINSSGQINTSVFNGAGYNEICFTMPYTSTEYLAYSFSGIGCNGGAINQTNQLLLYPCDGKMGLSYADTSTNKSISNTIKIYPDPFCASVTISNAKFAAGDFVTVADAIGRIVNKAQVVGENTSVNLDGVQSGIYFVNYKGVNGSTTQKMTKVCE